ncbi:hypothetical protein CEXT_56111 [Caerostris extrusa]|uniref:Uncharacterized protein n=1 Tax=Caerostris extrusa TaxID=172846 RepID=A0AAV4WZS8_CAEEX|nr:hypothetical protein CEXT_56111 [Caerostris extrusa]
MSNNNSAFKRSDATLFSAPIPNVRNSWCIVFKFSSNKSSLRTTTIRKGRRKNSNQELPSVQRVPWGLFCPLFVLRTIRSEERHLFNWTCSQCIQDTEKLFLPLTRWSSCANIHSTGFGLPTN